MAFTKHAALENAEILEIKGSSKQSKTASLEKFSEFDDYRTDDGYLYARIRAISSRVNKNHDGWPSVELAGGQSVFDKHLANSKTSAFTASVDKTAEYGFSTFLGKPIFVDHNNSDPSRARGVIVDAKLHVEDQKTSNLDPYYSSSDVNPLHTPPTWVELLLEIDAKSFPKFAQAIIDGGKDPNAGIDGFSMGANVERTECNICKNSASTPDEFCKHILNKGALYDYKDPETGQKTSKRSYEDCFGVQFFEISGVFDPADETALIREVVSSTKQSSFGMFSDGGNQEVILLLEKITAEFTQKAKSEDVLGALESLGNEATDTDVRERVFAFLNENDLLEDPENIMVGWKSTKSDIETLPETDHPLGPQTGSFQNEPKTTSVGPLVAGSGTDDISSSFLFADTEPVSSVSEGALAKAAKVSGNPEPQSEMTRLPKEVDTLRNEHICDICGSTMESNQCDVCGYLEPPEGFNTPDLTEAKKERKPKDSIEKTEDSNNLPLTAHVKTDRWKVSIPSRLAETVITPNKAPASDEPEEEIILDPKEPVTSNVRTAADFVAAAGVSKNRAGAKRRNMDRIADAASGAPEVANPDRNVDVEGVGGALNATNEGASKAQNQVSLSDIGGIGNTNPSSQSVSVDQGDEHSKNIEAIPTKTFGQGNSAVERQQSPVTNEVFPKQALFGVDVDGIGSAIGDAATSINDATDNFASGVGNAATGVGNAVGDAGSAIGQGASDAAGAIGQGVSDAGNYATGVGNAYGDAATGMADAFGTGASGIADASGLSGAAQGVGNALGDAATGVSNYATGVGNAYGDAATGMADAFGTGASGMTDALQNKSSKLGWRIEALDSGAFPRTEDSAAGGSAAHGTSPADPVGNAKDRVDVLSPATSPSNNSGPTKTWSGTDGNGVTHQQNPTTRKSLEDADGVKSAHLMTAFRLADMEIDLGLLNKEAKYARVEELQRKSSESLSAAIEYAQKVKTAGLSKGSPKTASRFPSFARNASVESTKTGSASSTPDEALFS